MRRRIKTLEASWVSASSPSRTVYRPGAILVATVVCVGVTMALILAIAQLTLMGSKQSLRWEWREQARWLLEAGGDRAVQQRSSQPNYTGETLRIPCGSAQRVAKVWIRILDTPEGRSQAKVSVRFPAEDRTGIYLTKTFSLQEPTDER